MNEIIEQRLRTEARSLPMTSGSALQERIHGALAAERAASVGSQQPVVFSQRIHLPWVAAAAALVAGIAVVFLSVQTSVAAPIAIAEKMNLHIPHQVVGLVPEIPAPMPASIGAWTQADFAAVDPSVPVRHEVVAIQADLCAVAGVIRQVIPY